MGMSEEELKGQITEMREAIQSIRASRRIGRAVSIVGVLVGLGVVAIYVYSFISMGKKAADPVALRAEVEHRIEVLDIPGSLQRIVTGVAPTVGRATLDLVKEMKLSEAALEQAKLMAKDLEPVVRTEVNRIAPKLQQILQDELDQTVKLAQERIEKKVGDRLAASIQRHSGQLEAGTQFNEQQLAQAVQNLQDAATGALVDVVQKRTGDLEDEMIGVMDVLDRIPPLPPKSQAEMMGEFRRVLAALLKEKLPAYPMNPAEFRRLPPIPAEAARRRAMAEAARKEQEARRRAEREAAQREQEG